MPTGLTCLHQLPGSYRRCGRPATSGEGGVLCPAHFAQKVQVPALRVAAERAANDLEEWARAFSDTAPSYAIAMGATAAELRRVLTGAEAEAKPARLL